MQAQDYYGALWAVGLRIARAVESDVEAALARREIVRSWPLRGTLHFVASEDLRWMLELIAPRVLRRSEGRMRREFDLDAPVFRRSRTALTRALRDGGQLTREGLYAVLEKAGIPTAKSRGLHVIFRLAHEGFLCFGARDGKKQTFALLDDWVGSSRKLRGDEALHELALRYFQSHAPATAADFAWWSGLPVTEARRAREMVSVEERDGEPLYRAYALPAFDEYLVAYKDRSAAIGPRDLRKVNDGGGMLRPVIVVGGRVAGTWRKQRAEVELSLFRRVTREDREAIKSAVARYKAFLGM